MRKVISEIPGGPPTIGPYSPAVVGEGKFLFVSGQIPFDVAAGKVVRATIGEQTRIVLENLKRLVEASGSSLDQIVSCRVYLQPLNPETFAEMNAVYAEVFGDTKPARATVGAGLLGFDVEIEAVALVGS
jgi:2-iminobutanoate/2-iminopropanoate deaminase